MLVNSEMGINTLGLSVALFLLSVLVVAPHGEEIGALGSPVSSASVKKAETLEEMLWANCRLEMIRSKEEYEDLDFSIFGTFGTNILANEILEEENIRKLMSVLYQQISPELFCCIREKVFISPISGDDSSSSKRYMKILESLVSKVPAGMRRYLAGVSEGPSQEVAQSPRSAASLSAVVQAPRSATSPSAVGIVVSSNSNADYKKDGNNHKTIVIAVVVTAVVTFIFALLLFVCCRKCLWKHAGNDCKDDRPLLISMSDYSGSPKSDVFHSATSQLNGFQSYGSYVGEGKQAGSLEGNMESAFVNAVSDRVDKVSRKPSTVKSDGSFLPLKLPPGRVPPSGLPQLRPPPGKAEPLPPEPPASLRPFPVRASASPPPPAPPPPAPPAPPPPARKPPPSGVGPPLGSAPPPPPIPGIKIVARPPPPLKGGSGLPCPPASSGVKDDADASRAKLKPFFWDKVLADPDHSMVWHQIKSGSFQFNEEMIESLFGYAPPDKNKPAKQKESSSLDSQPQFIQLIDPKKAQNLSILLRALNVTTVEVCDALEQGNELPPEFLETLLKMAPTPEEELKLRLFGGEPSQLGPAERFLKVLADIPFAFKRMDALLFMCTFDEEVASLRESFTILEAACKELKNSRLFLKLLEAVLKTGNRMNDGTFRGGAQAFKLDTLLKLSDVKGVDGKTTLLHFVVQQIIRSEGIRAARISRLSKSFSSVKSDDLLEEVEDESEEQLCTLGLQVVSSLGEQLENVKKAAGVDGDTLTGSIAKLRASFVKTRNFLNSEMKNIDSGNGFHRVLKCFVEEVDTEITSLSEEEKRITDLMKSTADYFHGTAGKEEGLRLFIIVRDFLIMLDRVCAQVRAENHKKSKGNSRNQKKDLPFH